MNARDELADELQQYALTHDIDDTKDWGDYADAILAAGYTKPRTITTTEELDALPSGSVILDSEGESNVLHDNGWVLPGSGGGYTTWAVAQYLPATVLYEPAP